jgi:hypothetical protein
MGFYSSTLTPPPTYPPIDQPNRPTQTANLTNQINQPTPKRKAKAGPEKSAG